VNNAKIGVQNRGGEFFVYWTPVGRNAETGKVYRHYARALFQLEGTPEEIVARLTEMSNDAFSADFYNEETRKASLAWHLAKVGEKAAKISKAPKKTSMSSKSKPLSRKNAIANLQKQIDALKAGN
jgi:hypothetical protein